MAEKMLISLGPIFGKPKRKRARKAIKRIRKEIAKRFHSSTESISISQELNSAIFAGGFEGIPRSISILIEQEKGITRAFLEGEKIPEKKEEKKKEKKEEEREEEEKEEIERKKREKRAKEVAAEKTAIKRKTDRA